MEKIDFEAMRACVRAYLEKSVRIEHSWTVQGFGMMRTYFGADKRFRLNLWDSRLAVPNVSIIHDHPWDFKSWIIGGQFINVRYDVVNHGQQYTVPPLHRGGDGRYHWMQIKTGEGGGPTGIIRNTGLVKRKSEFYKPGDTYTQKAEEIHASFYQDGTVTLNDRVKQGTGEHALVFWPYGESWVDAMPREATYKEIQRTVEHALTILDEYETPKAEADYMSIKAIQNGL